MLSYAFEGLGAGALVGLSGGYLAARGGDWDNGTSWRAVGLGVGIGSLAGMGLGLGLGAADLRADHPGVGGVVLRDMLYGTGVGVLGGALGGGIAAGVHHEGEEVLFGMAIGALAGAGTGLIVGLIEGPRVVRNREHQARLFTPSVATTRDAASSTVWLLGGTGRF